MPKMVRRSARGTLVGKGERLQFVEGLRGLAALYVVLGHFCNMVDPETLQGRPSEAPEWLRLLMAPFLYGHLAVASFIVISGFCLQVSLFHKGSGRLNDLRRFFSRRALRILPPYYACLLLSLGVALTITPLHPGMPFDQYLPVTNENVAAHFLLIHNLSPDWMYKINGVLWSIAIEAQLYLLFPFLVALLLRGGRASVLLLAAAASVGILSGYPTSLKLYPWYLGLFALGIVTAHFAYRPSMWLGPRPRWGLAIGLVAFAGCLWALASKQPMPYADTLIGIALAAALYSGAVKPDLLPVRVLSWRPVVALGLMSYSLYLMHHPIQQALYVFRPPWAEGSVMEAAYLTAIGLPVIILGCLLFWFVFERPFLFGRPETLSARRSYTPVSLPLGTAQRSRPEAEPLAPAAIVDKAPLAEAAAT